jgi:hypothetical protein
MGNRKAKSGGMGTDDRSGGMMYSYHTIIPTYSDIFVVPSPSNNSSLSQPHHNYLLIARAVSRKGFLISKLSAVQ